MVLLWAWTEQTVKMTVCNLGTYLPLRDRTSPGEAEVQPAFMLQWNDGGEILAVAANNYWFPFGNYPGSGHQRILGHQAVHRCGPDRKACLEHSCLFLLFHTDCQSVLE